MRSEQEHSLVNGETERYHTEAEQYEIAQHEWNRHQFRFHGVYGLEPMARDHGYQTHDDERQPYSKGSTEIGFMGWAARQRFGDEAERGPLSGIPKNEAMNY